MNEQASKITVGAIFKKIVKQMGFSGSGVTVYKEYDAYYLFVNYQKSSFGKRFYINVAWIFKDMLENSLSDDEKRICGKMIQYGRMSMRGLRIFQGVKVICSVYLIDLSRRIDLWSLNH